jgi:hypothetical protein
MKRILAALSLLVMLVLLAFLCCTRENPTIPNGTPNGKIKRQRIVNSSAAFWPCSTEAQIDSAFANFNSGDTIYIYSRADGQGHIIPYNMSSKRDTIKNATLHLIGEDTTAVLRSGQSGSAFLTCRDDDDVNDYVLEIKNLKLCKPSSGTGSLLNLSQNTILIENSVIADSSGQDYISTNFLTIAGCSFRNKGHANLYTSTYMNSTHHSFAYDIDNSVFCQYPGSTGVTNHNIHHYTYPVDGTFSIEDCRFYDQAADSIYMGIVAYANSVTHLILKNNYFFTGRLICQAIASPYTLSIEYDGNHENVGSCYEDVLSTLCFGNAGCATEIQIDNWIYSESLYGEGTLYGHDMFSGIEWSKDTQEGQVALEWNTTANCRGFAEIFSGEDCETAYTTAWDSSLSTSHSVTFDADLCDTYSAKISALPDGCDSLIHEGNCHSYDPRPEIGFNEFAWTEDAEEGQLTLSWSTSDSCMGFARIYSGQNCTTQVTSVWDSTWSTSHSVTFDADYCAYTSAKMYAKVPGCDSLIQEGNCHSHYFAPDVQFSNLSHSQDALDCTLTISWNTDVACKGRVFVYSGTVCGSAYGTYYDNNTSTSHSVTFAINPATNYSWKIYARFDNCYIYEGTCHYAKSGKCIMQR